MKFLTLSLVAGATLSLCQLSLATIAVAQGLENASESIEVDISTNATDLLSQTSSSETQPTVRNITIQFVNSRGEAVDAEGNPIQGQTES